MAETPASIRVRASETGTVSRLLEIEVEAPRVDAAFERAYRGLGRRARVRGFRPGRVPRGVLERLYGADVAAEVERELVRETLAEAVEQSGLALVAEPQVEARAPAPGKPFAYSARVEIQPEIRLGELSGLPGRLPRVELDEADVDRQLEQLRQSHAQLVEEPEDTEIAEGHVATVDYVGRIDGETFEGGTGREVAIEIGSDRFLPGFEQALLGARADEDREVRARFPDDHPEESLRGKEAVFAVHVVSVRRREVPDLDDEFAKDLGSFETLAALRERIANDLRAHRERQARAALHGSLLDALIERHEFEVPPGLVERRLAQRLATAHRQLHGSVPDDALRAQLQSWEQEWRPRAEREVRQTLLLEAVVRERGIEVDDADVAARIAEIAAEQGVSEARLRGSGGPGDLEGAVRAQLAEERALEFLAGEAKIEEVSSS